MKAEEVVSRLTVCKQANLEMGSFNDGEVTEGDEEVQDVRFLRQPFSFPPASSSFSQSSNNKPDKVIRTQESDVLTVDRLPSSARSSVSSLTIDPLIVQQEQQISRIASNNSSLQANFSPSSRSRSFSKSVSWGDLKGSSARKCAQYLIQIFAYSSIILSFSILN